MDEADLAGLIRALRSRTSGNEPYITLAAETARDLVGVAEQLLEIKQDRSSASDVAVVNALRQADVCFKEAESLSGYEHDAMESLGWSWRHAAVALEAGQLTPAHRATFALMDAQAAATLHLADMVRELGH